MAALFIDVKVDASLTADAAAAKKLVEVCPVNIFAIGKDGKFQIVEENLDECTLCDLCLPAGGDLVRLP